MAAARAFRMALPLVLLAGLTCSAAGQGLHVGDEVIYSGGPLQPPQTVKTGFSLDIKNVRGDGGTAGDAPVAGGPGQPAPIRGGRGGNSALPTGPGMASPEPEQPAVVPIRPRDLAGLPLPRLEELLLSSASPDDRFSAARALGKVALANRRRASELLREALQDGDLRVVREAVNGLVRLDDRGALPQMLELLNQSDPELLEAVIGAAGSLGDVRSVAPLKTFRDGGGGRLDVAAARSLKVLSARLKVR